MSRAETNKLYRTFTRGMITEAGYLTYPEDASTDELNTIISRKGNRTRRRGIDYEAGYELENLGVTDNDAFVSHVWNSVNNDTNVSFLVVQMGRYLYFYDLNGTGALSANRKSFFVDLAGARMAGTPVESIGPQEVSLSSGFGLLFVAHPLMEPFTVEYAPDSDTINAVRVFIQIRDFEGVYDGLSNDEEPLTLSPQHQYNLQNQGWIDPGTKGAPLPGTSSGGIYYNPYTGEQRGYNNNEELP